MLSAAARSVCPHLAVLGLAAASTATARQDCTPSWQMPFNASFSTQVTHFAMHDLRGDGRLTPVLCGTLPAGDHRTAAAVFQDGAWTPIDPPVRGQGFASLMFDFDGPGPLPPQLVLAGSIRVEDGAPFTAIGRLTSSGWVTCAPFGSPVVFCAKVLDEDGDGPLPPNLFIGTQQAGLQRWNGVDFDRLSFLALGVHTVVDLDTIDFDGPGPLPTRLLGMNGSGFVISNGSQWQSAPGGGGACRGFCVHDPDGAGPLPPAVYCATTQGLFSYGPDLVPRRVSIPNSSLSNVASIDTPGGPALVYGGVDAQARSVIRRSTDLVHWDILGDSSVFGLEMSRLFTFLEGVTVGQHGRRALAAVRGQGTPDPSALFVYGCPFEGGCPADFNGDGFIDCFDYTDFVAAFEGGASSADVNHDGFGDFFDYADFVDLFQTGC